MNEYSDMFVNTSLRLMIKYCCSFALAAVAFVDSCSCYNCLHYVERDDEFMSTTVIFL